MDPKKHKKLAALLSVLPDRMVRVLAVAIEQDRLAGGGLPHDDLLNALRPGLRRTGLKREGVAPPERVVFEPVSDLLVTETPAEKQRGVIARSSLMPLWHWFDRELMTAETRRWVDMLKTALSRGDTETEGRIAAELREAVANALGRAFAQLVPGSPEFRRVEAELGGGLALADGREIAALLEAAPAFSEIRARIPLGCKRLSEADLRFLHEAYERLGAELPDQCDYIPVLVMRRLARPWKVMEVLKTLGRFGDDTMLAHTTLGLAGELLLKDLEAHADYLVSLRLGEANTTEALGHLERFADNSAGITNFIDIKRFGPWGRRLVKVRKAVSDAMERQIERLPDVIIAAFPLQTMGAFGPKGVHRPDTRRWPEDVHIDRAANLAMFLAAARWDANKALFSAAHREATERVTRFLIAYGDFLMIDLRAAQGDEDAGARCQSHLQALTRITELVLGPDEAGLLRQRAANIASATAAA